jgi:intraflagellar transport protein 56
METTSNYICFLLTFSRKAMDIYDELMKRPDYDRNLHSYKACCLYALCSYKEAMVEAQKAEEAGLKNRLLFQLA